MSKPRPLELATTTYYWKPMAALFRALELRCYATSGVALEAPLLDLGCGDGRVLGMLAEAGLAERPCYGVDLSARELAKARSAGVRHELLRASANALPFQRASFRSVIANGTLAAVSDGAEQALGEVRRVLRPDGVFVATVPTDAFTDVLLWPGLLGAFSNRSRDAYVRRLNARLPHINAHSPEKWVDLFERCGLQPTTVLPFLGPRAGRWWSVLATQVVRGIGASKLLPDERARAVLAPVLQRVLQPVYEADRNPGPTCGYLFIAARGI